MEAPKNYTEGLLKNTDKPKEEQKSPENRLSEATKERVKIEKEIDNALRSYEKVLYKTYNLKSPESGEDVKALNLYKQIQILRAKFSEAKIDKLEQLVNEFNELQGRVAEFVAEERNPIEEQRIKVAFEKTKVETPDQDSQNEEARIIEETPNPANLSGLDYLAQEDESSPISEIVNSADLLTGEKVDKTVEFAKVEADQIIMDEMAQKENLVTEKLIQINSDTEPQNASRLIKSIWKQTNDKLGNLVSVSAHTDNANLVFELKDGSKKIVAPQALDTFAKRSFSAFKEKYLKNIPDFEEQVTEIAFGEEAKAKPELTDIAGEASGEQLDLSKNKKEAKKLDEFKKDLEKRKASAENVFNPTDKVVL